MISPYYVRHADFSAAWHITIGGDWNTVALCGERPSDASSYWTTRRKFHEERDPRLEVDARGVCARCGDINDGVLFEHVEPHHWKGCWLVSFADLQDMYFRAANERHMSLEHVGRAYLDFLGPPEEATHP